MRLLHQGGQGRQSLMQGVIKLYDPNTGAGIIIRDDDQSGVFLRAGSLAGSIFRTLRQGQRINFETDVSDSVLYARNVRVGQDGY